MISPIVVCTYPRSGSSLTCGLLHEAGIWVGPSKEQNAFNPKGFFENRELMALGKRRDKLLKWRDVKPILSRQGWKGQRWLVKVKAGRWMPWRGLDPIFIKVRRSPEAILASRTRKIQRIPEKEQREINTTIHILDHEIPGHTVWPERLVAGDASEFREVWAALGLTWSANFLDKRLWHFPGREML